MARLSNMVNLLFIGVFVFSLFGSNVEGLGVNWGTKSNHQLPPETVVQMIKDNGFKKVKLFDIDPHVMDALADTDIEVMMPIKNSELHDMINRTNAEQWVKQNITKYLEKKVKIRSVAVGNEPFLKDYKDLYRDATLPALENIQRALNKAHLGEKIKATVPFNGDVYMSPPWRPYPSAGIFRPDVADEVEDIADFLAKNKAPFMVNIYPFISLTMGNGAFPIEYAFFDSDGGIKDDDVEYTNVFDANFDTCVSALKNIGHGNMSIIVGEIGWPTDGNPWANITLASRFYKGFLPRLAQNKGTPLRPGHMEVYLFGLLDEDAKSVLPGGFERHWGMFDYAGQPKFKVSLGGGKDKDDDDKKELVGAKHVEYQPKRWCVLKQNAPHDKKKFNDSATYACDRADCTAFFDGGSCSGLNDFDKTSYALNAYFQVSKQSNASCEFGGLATQVEKDPSTDHCKFNIQIKPYDPESDSKHWWNFWSSSSPPVAPPMAFMVSVVFAVISFIFY